jgi:hypothetical protein
LTRVAKPISGRLTTLVRYASDITTGDTLAGRDKLTCTSEGPLAAPEGHGRGMQSAAQLSQVSSKPSSPSPHIDTRVGVGVTDGVAVDVGGAGVKVSVAVGRGGPQTE